MEPLAVDDDICILKHETAYTPAGESPVSVCAGDESVASHFALVTAYEDIKKRLRDTERDNTLLKKRVKQLEEKLFRPEAPPSEGPHYVNKAFSAYRGIYIEKEDLQMELNKLKKEKSENERLLNEQLQAKELELLQLRSEMETTQVMKSLNSPQDFWQMERVDTELQIRKLQEDLERIMLENSRLLERSTVSEDRGRRYSFSLSLSLLSLQIFLPPAASTVPVHAPPVPSCSGRPCPAGPPLEACAVVLPPPPLNQASLDDSSRSFPSPPKPTDAMFWEGHSNGSNSSSSLGNFIPMSPPSAEWAKPY
uniref:5-azacytidine induced 2 n=1 Tax=Xiphophorus couchianus TaxID=32473 RepID=A0A3B5MKP8_9TELE